MEDGLAVHRPGGSRVIRAGERSHGALSWAWALAGLAAGAWGFSDFIAGFCARRLPVRSLLIGSKLTGMLLALLYLAGRADPLPGGVRLVVLSAAAGTIGVPSMGLLYRAMRDGSLTVVAPVAAGAALVPVGWGLLHGERLGAGGVIGAVAALAGITLASWPAGDPAGPRRRPAVWCAAGAAAGFGTFFVLLHEAAPHDPFGAAAYALIFGGLAGCVLLAATGWQTLRGLPPRLWIFPLTVGTLEPVADAAFAWSASGAAIGAAAIVASLYPAVTVLLNRVVLREKLPALHLCGVLSALAGVACLAG
ncbi:EamA family transporter [Actinoplanes sp. CA-252034]|uniref:EamA family transporter n=1 Tax=Actinoplanes sp. CA-252034 TaxID=3239906 RepID=UPI003D996F4A